jgi:hypothetical protein
MLANISFEPLRCSAARTARDAAKPAGAPWSAWSTWLIAAGSAGCIHPPKLERPAWDVLRPGRVAFGHQLGLGTLYGIDGHFEADTPDFGTGMPTHHEEDDSGEVVGKWATSAQFQVALGGGWSAVLGALYRRYDVEHLNPISELPVSVDAAASEQYFVGIRRWLPPVAGHERWRPWLEGQVAFVPGVDIGFELDLSAFGNSNIRAETESEDYWVGAAGTGIAYQWSDRALLELGATYEFALAPFDATLPIEIPNGSSTLLVPIESEFDPAGLVAYLGLAWFF